MYLERYWFETDENLLEFTFISEGPNGKIKKAIRFVRMIGQVYNLSFGDLNEITGEIADTVVTNNNDSLKILNTVAASVHDFFSQYPDVYLFIKGSTHSRTRLYRRAITLNWETITKAFTVHGKTEEGWEFFVHGKDYPAFLIHTN